MLSILNSMMNKILWPKQMLLNYEWQRLTPFFHLTWWYLYTFLKMQILSSFLYFNLYFNNALILTYLKLLILRLVPWLTLFFKLLMQLNTINRPANACLSYPEIFSWLSNVSFSLKKVLDYSKMTIVLISNIFSNLSSNHSYNVPNAAQQQLW